MKLIARWILHGRTTWPCRLRSRPQCAELPRPRCVARVLRTYGLQPIRETLHASSSFCVPRTTVRASCHYVVTPNQKLADCDVRQNVQLGQVHREVSAESLKRSGRVIPALIARDAAVLLAVCSSRSVLAFRLLPLLDLSTDFRVRLAPTALAWHAPGGSCERDVLGRPLRRAG